MDMLISKCGDRNYYYIQQMAVAYGLDVKSIPVEKFLDGDNLTEDKQRINKEISDYLTEVSANSTNAVQHRVVDNISKLASAPVSGYNRLVRSCSLKEMSITSSITKTEEARAEAYTQAAHTKKLHEELLELQAKKPEAFKADLIGDNNGCALGGAFVKMAEGGKFLYSHSRVQGELVNHYFLLNHEVVLEDINFGKYFFHIKLTKEGKHIQDSFHDKIVVRPYLDNLFSEDEEYYHPHISESGIICWGNLYDEARAAYDADDFVKLVECIYSLVCSYNDDDPYKSVRHFEEEGEEVHNSYKDWSDGTTIFNNCNKVYPSTAPAIVTNTSEKSEYIKSFIDASIAAKKEGVAIAKWDIVFNAKDKLCYRVLERRGEKARCTSLEELHIKIECKYHDVSDLYTIPAYVANKFKVLKEVTSTHGYTMKIGHNYRRTDANGRTFEGQCVNILPEYVNTSGVTKTIAVLYDTQTKVCKPVDYSLDYKTECLTEVKNESNN